MRILYTGTRKPRWEAPSGVSVVWEPLLMVEALNVNEEELTRLARQEGVGLVFYSRHAIAAVGGVLAKLGRDIPIWAVGSVCMEDLSHLGFERVFGPTGQAQNFEGLVQMMRGDDLPQQIIALGLEGARRPLAQRLKGVCEVVDVDVYRSIGRRDFPIIEVVSQPPAWVVLTSPRAVGVWHRLGGGDVEAVRVASIGPTTTAACEALGLRVAHEASVPKVATLLCEVARSGV